MTFLSISSKYDIHGACSDVPSNIIWYHRDLSFICIIHGRDFIDYSKNELFKLSLLDESFNLFLN